MTSGRLFIILGLIMLGLTMWLGVWASMAAFGAITLAYWFTYQMDDRES